MWILAQVPSSDDAAAGAFAGLLAGGIIVTSLIIFAIIYVIFALSLMTLAKKTNTPNEMWAWIPLVQLLLLAGIAELPQMYGIALIACWVLSFAPVIGILFSLASLVLTIYMWWKVAERRGKPGPIALLWIVPCLGIFVPLYLAYSE